MSLWVYIKDVSFHVVIDFFNWDIVKKRRLFIAVFHGELVTCSQKLSALFLPSVVKYSLLVQTYEFSVSTKHSIE